MTTTDTRADLVTGGVQLLGSGDRGSPHRIRALG
jgi:hypothetical protein